MDVSACCCRRFLLGALAINAGAGTLVAWLGGISTWRNLESLACHPRTAMNRRAPRGYLAIVSYMLGGNERLGFVQRTVGVTRMNEGDDEL